MSLYNIRNVSFRYKKDWILENLNLELAEGRVYGLLGRNGAGKSTFMGLLSGLLKPQAGEIDCGKQSPFNRNYEFLKNIFYLSDEFEFPSVSIRNYIRTNGPFYPRFSYEDLRQYLNLLEIDQYGDLGKLSYGQKRKFHLAFSVACNTRIILFDEPTSGLDIIGRQQFRKLMALVSGSETTVMISAHQINDVESLIEEMLVVENRQVLQFPVEQINETFSFTVTRAHKKEQDYIFKEEALTGTRYICKKDSDSPVTDINIELFYKAVINNPAGIYEALKPTKSEQ